MTQLTEEGYNQLKEELKELEEKTRPEVAQKLKDAIAEGDLSENAAYEEAKDRQARVEGRIGEIKQVLAQATIVKNEGGNKVNIGSSIKVKSSDGTERTFTITGSEESNPSEGKLSYTSPLGKAFVGHKQGDKVDVEIPSGTKTYEIIELKN